MAAPPVTEEVQAQNSPQVTVYTIDYGTSLLPDPKNNLFGLDIFLDARVSGSGYANFNWEQTVTTNYPLDDKPANQPYPDPGPDPFYYSNTPDKVPLLSAQGFAERVAQQHGASTIFEDHPVRDLKGLNPVIWHAELSLVGIKNNGAVDVLKSFSYGFTLTNGGVILEPLKEK